MQDPVERLQETTVALSKITDMRLLALKNQVGHDLKGWTGKIHVHRNRRGLDSKNHRGAYES